MKSIQTAGYNGARMVHKLTSFEDICKKNKYILHSVPAQSRKLCLDTSSTICSNKNELKIPRYLHVVYVSPLVKIRGGPVPIECRNVELS